jgi:hypothetical protein
MTTACTIAEEKTFFGQKSQNKQQKQATKGWAHS